MFCEYTSLRNWIARLQSFYFFLVISANAGFSKVAARRSSVAFKTPTMTTM